MADGRWHSSDQPPYSSWSFVCHGKENPCQMQVIRHLNPGDSDKSDAGVIQPRERMMDMVVWTFSATLSERLCCIVFTYSFAATFSISNASCIPGLDVVVVLKPHTALIAGGNFLNIILEATPEFPVCPGKSQRYHAADEPGHYAGSHHQDVTTQQHCPL